MQAGYRADVGGTTGLCSKKSKLRRDNFSCADLKTLSSVYEISQ